MWRGSAEVLRVSVCSQDGRRSQRHARGELGSIVASWLVQLLLVLVVLGTVGYEVISIGLTSVGVDDASRQVARAARDAYRSADRSLDEATTVAVEAATTHRATVADVSLHGEVLSVTLRREAPTLLVHRIGPIAHLATREATARASVVPR